MASPTGFSVPSSEVVSISDTSAINHSSSSDQSTLLSMEQKKLKSLSGHAIAVTTEKSGSSNVHKAAQSSTTITSRPVTERNVQLHAAQHKAVSRTTSQVGSVVSSAERARRYELVKAVFETAQARQMMLQAAEEVATGSQTGSVGRRLDDVRSDTGSSGPSPPITAQESPFVGIFSSPVPPTPTTTIMATPTIFDAFSAGRGVHILDAIGDLNMPCASTEQSGTASGAGLSRTRPAPHSP